MTTVYKVVRTEMDALISCNESLPEVYQLRYDPECRTEALAGTFLYAFVNQEAARKFMAFRAFASQAFGRQVWRAQAAIPILAPSNASGLCSIDAIAAFWDQWNSPTSVERIIRKVILPPGTVLCHWIELIERVL